MSGVRLDVGALLSVCVWCVYRHRDRWGGAARRTSEKVVAETPGPVLEDERRGGIGAAAARRWASEGETHRGRTAVGACSVGRGVGGASGVGEGGRALLRLLRLRLL